MKLLISLLFTLLLIGIFALGSGAYNMAATDKHWAVTERIIEWVRNSSIKARSSELQVPPLDEEDLLAVGAEHYNAMCTACHLSPGREPTELALGLYPQAPVFHKQEALADETDKLEHARAYFWVIKNGLKMTAMPAWGLTHSDNDIWAMTAFILKMSNMTLDQYKDLVSSSNNHDHGIDNQDHENNGHQH